MRTKGTALAILLLLAACTLPRDIAPDCDINAAPCERQIREGLKATFEIFPRPVRSMAEVSFAVLLERDGVPVDDAAISMDLTMPGMYMGENFFTLEYMGEGVYRKDGVLPRCPQGKKLWRAKVSVTRNGMAETITYLFEVEK
jgi:hypothetical protein